MSDRRESEQQVLSWTASDPEERLFFRGGRFTRVNTACSFLIGLLLTVLFYAALTFAFSDLYITRSFTQRGFVPYLIALFFFWALATLALKQAKLRLQRRALDLRVMPDDPDFVLSPRTVNDVLDRIYSLCDDPRRFVLFNRIVIALSNLRNLGRVTDVDDILRAQAEHDESSMETSYFLLHGFVWAVPVLGFIGTVQGLSAAIGGFGMVLSGSSELTQLKDALREVTAGLSVAFETTFQGLVAALILQLLLTSLKRAELEFLDQCTEYCVRHVVGKLRLMPYEPETDS